MPNIDILCRFFYYRTETKIEQEAATDRLVFSKIISGEESEIKEFPIENEAIWIVHVIKAADLWS